MKILLVEDHDADAERVIRPLESASYIVDQVKDVDSAEFSARIDEYSAGVLDLALSTQDDKTEGLELIRQLRVLRTKQFPIMVITRHNEVATELEALRAGAQDFLPKPFVPELFLLRLNSMIALANSGDTYSPFDTTKLICGPYSLDMTDCKVRLEGRSLSLPKQQFRLMRYLMTIQRVASPEEIISNVWDDPGKVTSRDVHVLVSKLRKKLNPGNKFPLSPIETSRETGGYRLRNFDDDSGS